VITVTPAGPGAAAPKGAGTSPIGGARTTKWSGYGADFALAVPSACQRKGTAFSVTLGVKKRTKAKAKGRSVLVKVTKVVFAVDGKTVKTLRSAPFRAQLTLPSTASSGRTVNLSAKAYLVTGGRKRHVKSMTVGLKVC
jgi:hypothetical protein